METFIKMWINQVFTALHFFSVVEKMILIFWYNKTMRIKIISVGKLKEKYLKAGIAEYVKRLSRFGQVEIVELADEKTPDKASEKENAQILSKEGDRILAKLTDRDFVFS